MPTGAPANFCQLLIAGDSSRTSRRYASTGDADRCTVKHMQSPHPPIGGTGHPSLRPLWLQVPAAWRGWAPGAGRLGWASLSPHLFVSKLPLSPPSHPPPSPLAARRPCLANARRRRRGAGGRRRLQTTQPPSPSWGAVLAWAGQGQRAPGPQQWRQPPGVQRGPAPQVGWTAEAAELGQPHTPD